jgi:hypothetical protein
MTSDQSESHGASGSNGSEEPIPPPASLPELQNCKTRLLALLDAIDVQPESLDSQANYVHTDLVIPAYILMKTDVAMACKSRWDNDGRQRFRDTYHAAADEWSAYEPALVALQLVPQHDQSAVVDAKVQLRKPRRGYIDALSDFCNEFSATLDFLFPPDSGEAR